jgi:hypothetical protein
MVLVPAWRRWDLKLRSEAMLQTQTEDVIKSSEIEGRAAEPGPGPVLAGPPPWLLASRGGVTDLMTTRTIYCSGNRPGIQRPARVAGKAR